MQTYQLEKTATQLMQSARQVSGVDFLDGDIEEALGRLVDALNSEAQLTQAGAASMEQRLLMILANRLHRHRDCSKYPEIERQEIARPVFLTGAGRSGSTKLHKLLAATGDFKYLRFWQGFNPAMRTGLRVEDPSDRVREAQEFIEWFDERSPDARRIHEYRVFEPEEETFLFDHSRFLINFCITHANVPSYMNWVMGQDMAKQLEDLKRWLKYLQWQFHDGDLRPWLLKNPLYNGMEPILAQIFPGAVYVCTHREPSSRVSSSAGLTLSMQKAYSDADRISLVGPAMLEFMAMGANQALAMRDAFPTIDILDIGYQELTKQSERVAEKVYELAGRTLSPRSRSAISAWELGNAQHKHGVYRHDLAAFGITSATVDEKFAPYVARFRPYF